VPGRDPDLAAWPRRRPRAAGGRPLAGLEFVEKLLTTKLTSTDATERNARMLRVLLVASLGRPGDWLEFLVVLALFAACSATQSKL
jgi:hypothetical protein